MRVLIVLLALTAATQAQEFVGYVVADSLFGEPIHQATVTIRCDGKMVKQLKTTFDGTFRFKPDKNKTYDITASMVRYADTTIRIRSNEKRYTDKPGAKFVLKKYGLRLEGYILDKSDQSPVADVVLVQKNIRTKEIRKHVTGKDGYFNIYLDYETNYRIHLDKYSPGMLNIYEDTTFYLSTVGFTQPLDYRLNIHLRKIRGYVKPRPDYDPMALPARQPLAEIVEVKASSEDTLRRDSVMKIREAERQAFEKQRLADSAAQAEAAAKAAADSLMRQQTKMQRTQAETPLPNDTAALRFRVQLALLPQPNPQLLKLKFSSGKVVAQKTPKGLWRYLVSDLPSKEAALKVRTEALKFGFTKASVAAFRNGKRLTVEEFNRLK